MDIDGVRFKVEGDLSKLEADLKKGEGVAKKGGDVLGRATGKAFSKSFTSDADAAISGIEKKASLASETISSVFTKVGATVAAAFSVDKIIGFFSDSAKYAEKMEKDLGAVGKAANGTSQSMEEISGRLEGASDKLKGSVGPAILNIKKAMYESLASMAEWLTNFLNPFDKRVVNSYQTIKKELAATAQEADKLNAINNKTAAQEIQLIQIKESLAKQASKLGLDYEKLAMSAKSYLEVSQKIAAAAKERAQADLTTAQVFAINNAALAKDTIKQQTANEARLRASGDIEQADILKRGILDSRKRMEDEIAEFKRLGQTLKDLDKDPTKTPASTPGGGVGKAEKFQEERFLDSRERLNMIAANQEYTIQKAKNEKLSAEEFERRKAMAKESAKQDTENEINSLRQGYAQFIEENTAAKMRALEMEHNNAKRLSFLLLETELREAGKNEEKRAKAIKENDDRIAKSREANARKQAAITLQSMADNLNAAKDIAGGVNALANSRDAGSAFGATGGILTGASKLSPALGALGPLGSAVGAVGGVASALTSLFGKSDEQRAREAAEAQRVAQEQIKLLELQNNYTKNILALQEQGAKLPFEQLQRKLRLVDIQSQSQRLAGVDERTVETERLQRRQGLISETISSQAGAIGGQQLFAGTDTSAGGLINFLNDRGAQSVAISQFVEGFKNINPDIGNRAIGDAQIAKLNYYRGRIPNAFFGPFDDFVANREAAIQEVAAAKSRFQNNATGNAGIDAQNLNNSISSAVSRANNSLAGNLNSINTLDSEVRSDTGVAESMVSLLEQSQTNELEIAANTKKTADNTTKLVETPQRQSSIIDISRGYTRSLGQILNPGITNTALPSSVQAAVLATDIQKSIQERSLDKLQNIETIQRDSRELLAIIAKGVNTNASGSLLAELESLYRRSIAA